MSLNEGTKTLATNTTKAISQEPIPASSMTPPIIVWDDEPAIDSIVMIGNKFAGIYKINAASNKAQILVNCAGDGGPSLCGGFAGKDASNAIILNLNAERRESAVIRTAEAAVANNPTPGTSVARPASFTTDTRTPIKNTGTMHQGLMRSIHASK